MTSFLWVALSSQHALLPRSARGGKGGQGVRSNPTFYDHTGSAGGQGNTERTLWSEDVAVVSS